MTVKSVRIEDIAHKLSKADLITLTNEIQYTRNVQELEKVLIRFSAETGISLYTLFSTEIEDLLVTSRRRRVDRHYFQIVRSRILNVLSLVLANLSKKREEYDKTLIDKEFDVRKTGAAAK